MNIFILDRSSILSAQYHCDKHVVKMILEGLAIINATFWHWEDDYPKPGWTAHPCTLWAANSRDNLIWLADQTHYLCKEYTFRYGKTHSSEPMINAMRERIEFLPIQSRGLTPFIQCMPDFCKQEDAVQAYRKYYNQIKYRFAIWTKREVPDWFNPIKELGKHEP